MALRLPQLLFFGFVVWSNVSLSTTISNRSDDLSPELSRRRISPPKPNEYKCTSASKIGSESISSCQPNPCKNGGRCVNEGASLSCKCPVQYGGAKCEEQKGECVTYGDPHYFTFNKQRFDFMGKGRFVLSEDCVDKTFKLRMLNDYCGHRKDVTCLVELLIQFNGNIIRFYRNKPEIALNQKRYILTRPMCGKGFVLRRESSEKIILTTDFGLEIEWNGDRTIRVFLLERYKAKTCGLCANYGVNDNMCGAKGKCNENPVMSGFCQPGREDVVKKCDLMLTAPFQTCNGVINPSTSVQDCKFDACRCDDPWECVCSAFATYSKDCADSGKGLSWRSGHNAYQPLNKCAKTCPAQQAFTECGSSCVKTCRDLESSAPCNEECIAECQCPKGQLLNDQGKCIAREQCSCHSGSKEVAPGESIKNGHCQTCTCNSGVLKCKDDCVSKPKPKPCDSSPCKNGGVCTNEGDSFSCKCPENFEGETCKDVTGCANPQALGMENGEILDSQLTSSSAWSTAYNAANGGRLNSIVAGNRKDAWVARRGDNNPWLQVEFQRQGIITKIATQGRQNYNQWVKTYTVSFSNDGKNFNFYKQDGQIKVRETNPIYL